MAHYVTFDLRGPTAAEESKTVNWNLFLRIIKMIRVALNDPTPPHPRDIALYLKSSVSELPQRPSPSLPQVTL